MLPAVPPAAGEVNGPSKRRRGWTKKPCPFAVLPLQGCRRKAGANRIPANWFRLFIKSRLEYWSQADTL